VSGSWRWLGGVVLAWMVGVGASCAIAQANVHTDPLNLNPVVRQGYAKLYNLDYDGALVYFDKVSEQHPNEPMAWNYVLMATMFRELYHQDLLDTTYYAHDNFLTNKRNINVAPATRARIEDLTDKVISMCNARLQANPQDKNALFARGYAKGMHAVFLTLVDHAFAAAARQGYSARNDSEAVLKIDPQYADADMAIGIQKFAVASLPRWVRFLVGIMGVGGNKEQGLALLRVSAEHGVVTSVESRTILSLFLRHDGRYAQGLVWQHGLAEQFPHNFLFELEVANLLKDEGQGYKAMDAYKHVLDLAKQPGYFVDARLQLAYFGLADTERGYNEVPAAAADYVNAAEQQDCSSWLRKRAQLNAGEMYDLLHQRKEAKDMYYMAAAPGGDQSQAEAARKYLETPYQGK
jgi:tetratricopeptide (TPR) repeat protein